MRKVIDNYSIELDNFTYGKLMLRINKINGGGMDICSQHMKKIGVRYSLERWAQDELIFQFDEKIPNNVVVFCEKLLEDKLLQLM